MQFQVTLCNLKNAFFQCTGFVLAISHTIQVLTCSKVQIQVPLNWVNLPPANVPPINMNCTIYEIIAVVDIIFSEYNFTLYADNELLKLTNNCL